MRRFDKERGGMKYAFSEVEWWQHERLRLMTEVMGKSKISWEGGGKQKL